MGHVSELPGNRHINVEFWWNVTVRLMSCLARLTLSYTVYRSSVSFDSARRDDLAFEA
jgi:hypothetical protein